MTPHTIKKLSFGDSFPGLTNPGRDNKNLEIRDRDVPVLYKVVPTQYNFRSGSKVLCQTSIPQRNIFDHNFYHIEGVAKPFIFFDISPIRVRIDEQYKSFSTFLTSLCAIVGGVFTMMSLLDQWTHRTFKIGRRGVLGR